jgi:anti-sigma B factor antagonist
VTGVVVRHAGRAHVVTLTGDVDHATATDVERDVLLRTGSAEAVVLDLGEVTYLDSAGVTLLDHVVRTLDRRAVPFRVVAPAGSPARFVLRIVAFDEAAVAATLDEALAGLRGS